MEGIIHYELLEKNLTVTAECYCQQLRKNAQFDMELFISMTTPNPTHCKHDESGH
jgi:hypothetical protein